MPSQRWLVHLILQTLCVIPVRLAISNNTCTQTLIRFRHDIPTLTAFERNTVAEKCLAAGFLQEDDDEEDEDQEPVTSSSGGAALLPPGLRPAAVGSSTPRRRSTAPRGGPPIRHAAAEASFLEYQEEQAEWSSPTMHGTPPAPRGGHCAHLHLQTLYIYGGCTMGSRARCYNDIHALDTGSLTWSPVTLAGAAPHPSAHIACASAGPTLAVFGGYAGTYSNAVHLFDAEQHTWTRAQPAGTPPKGRQGATLTRVANKFILIGGSDDALHYNDVHVLSADGKSWTQPAARCVPEPCALPPAREGHTAALVGSKLWIHGGVGRIGRGPYTALTSLVYLDVNTYTWHDPEMQMQSTDLSLSARSLAASVTLGSRFMLLGGLTTPKRTPLGDAAVIDTETFSWSRPLPTGHAPPARSGMTATLRGRTVFTFGGCGEAGCSDELQSFQFQYVRRASGDSKLPALAGPPIHGVTKTFYGGCPNACSSHGKCWQRRCFCDPGWEGHDCSVEEPCDCNGQGVCAHGRCFCDPGFEGEHCELQALCASNCTGRGDCIYGRCHCHSGYTGGDCSEVVQCHLGCSQRGICVNGLCFCNNGASGDGCENTLPCPGGDVPCNGNGVCHESKCLCAPGYSGVGCEVALPCPSDCRDKEGVQRGKCEFGQCWCDPGFTGADCSLVATCPNDCTHRGVCFRDRCECEPGYGGSDCGKYLFECALNCSGHGACRQGECMCEPGWKGDACEVSIPCPRDCSSNGVCFSGQCLCNEGFGGVDCAVQLSVCENDCSHNGLCVSGVCSCELDWAGVDCSEPRKCLNDCNGNGHCKHGQCYCGPGYDGPDCSIPLGCESADQCGGRGVCSQGRCFCDPGFFGKNCTLAIQCPHDCGDEAQGVCAQGRCFCHTGWEGEDCTTPAACPADADGTTCGGRGKCLRGMCVCDPGFTGDRCDIEQTCPYGCHNQGECWGGRCLCFPGFEGEDCSNLIACPEDCSSHGMCVHGMCFCDMGFGGDACELAIPCPNECSHHGICSHSRCFCDAGYGGDDCSEQVRCPISKGLVCAGRGVCVLGSCVCVAGISGIDCTQVLSASSPLAILEDTVRGPTPVQQAALEANVANADGLVEYRTQPVTRAAKSRRLLFATGVSSSSSEHDEDVETVLPSGRKLPRGVRAPPPPSPSQQQTRTPPSRTPPSPPPRAPAPPQFKARPAQVQQQLLVEPAEHAAMAQHRDHVNALAEVSLRMRAQAAARGAASATSAGEPSMASPATTNETEPHYHVQPVGRHATARRLLYAPSAFLQSGGGPSATSLIEPRSEPAFRSRTAAEAAQDVAAAAVWPSAEGKAQLQAKAKASLVSTQVAKASSTPPPSPPPSMCLGGCSQRGICWEGRCFCDPGWGGDDCAIEQACKPGLATHGACSLHGVCAYGVCFCDPGFEGEACETVVPCPGQCSGHGECHAARCYCEPGWHGEACDIVVPIVDSGCNVGLASAVLVQLPVALVGLGIGWGFKYAAEQRQRAKMREILQQDAQKPFVSG